MYEDFHTHTHTKKYKKQEDHGPQCSPELTVITAVSLSGYLLVIPYHPVKFQGNNLISFSDILLTKLKCEI